MAFALGIDVSRQQGRMDWRAALAAGVKFAFIRAGSADSGNGVPYTDVQYDRNKSAAVLLPMGAYWYYRPDWSSSHQADYFCNLLADIPFAFEPIVSLETTGRLSPTTLTNHLEGFSAKIHAHTQKRVMIHSRASFWNACILGRKRWRGLHLWIARYSTHLAGPWADNLYKPRDWDIWQFWQWSNTGHGADFGAEHRNINLNYFNGDEQALQTYLTGGGPILHPTPLGTCHTTAAALSLYSGPSVNYTDLGRLEVADLTNLYWFETDRDIQNNVWLRIGPAVWTAESHNGTRYVVRD